MNMNMDGTELYEGGFLEKFPTFVALQPMGEDPAIIPHMKAMDVPFHLVHGSLISFKVLQNDGPKCRGMSVDPRRTQ